MPDLSAEDVAEIARLARLDLDAKEVESLRGDLTAILDHMTILQSLDTDGVEPMTHAVPMDLRLRADEVVPSLPVDTALADAPERADDHFQVPNVINTGSGER